MKKWHSLKKENLFKSSFFSLDVEKCRLPDHSIMPNYYVLNFSDWVHVVALTKNKEIILVKQYRHAAKKSFIEIPGGGIDVKLKENEKILNLKNMKTKKLKKWIKKETPLQAGHRELLEETGYSTKKMKKIGFHYPNPALLSNKIHVFLALECEKIKEPNLDPYEDLKVIEWKIQKLIRWMNHFKLGHSLIIASLYMALKKIKFF